jgi:Lipid-A-disaccharide synthetase
MDTITAVPPMSDAVISPQPAPSSPPPAAEVVLAGNGPGELQGWIAPVARAARALGDTGAAGTRITLALTPTQFAGGREREVAESWQLFDRILDPTASVRISLGLQRYAVRHPGVLIHLGGDLLLSGRLAARLGVPACAFAETDLVARRHRYFRRIFTATEPLARTLAAHGVPGDHIVVTGDPRGDLLAGIARRDTPAAVDSPVISFLPGSRDRFFEILAPFFLETARALSRRLPAARPQFLISEFLTPSLVETFAAAVRIAAEGAPAAWRVEQGWAAVGRSDFAVTIPGTNTLELAMAGIPFAVIVPTQHLARMPLEGLLEWVARLPGLGSRLRHAGLRSHLRRERFLAIPNKRAGRAIVPEWIGPLDPEEVAARVAGVLRDGPTLAAMAASFRGLDLARPGASALIAAEALAVASPAPAR